MSLYFRCYTIILSVLHCGGRSELALIKPTFHIQCFLKINLESATTNIWNKSFLFLPVSDIMGLINDTQPQPFPLSCTCKYGSPSVTLINDSGVRSTIWNKPPSTPVLRVTFIPNKSCLYTYWSKDPGSVLHERVEQRGSQSTTSKSDSSKKHRRWSGRTEKLRIFLRPLAVKLKHLSLSTNSKWLPAVFP